MQLFDNFDNQPQNYIPNNMFPRIPEIMVSLDDDTIKPIFRDGRLVGYKWNWGDVIKLPIKNEIHIKIPAGSLTTYVHEEAPTTDTQGDFIGQKFYNFTDFRSWTLKEVLETEPEEPEEDLSNCVGYAIVDQAVVQADSDTPQVDPQDTPQDVSYAYVWEEDKMFTYSKNIGQDYTLPLPWNEHDQIVVQLFNFRKEPIRQYISYEPDFVWELTPDESLTIVPGIYFLNVHIENRFEDISTYLRLTNAYEIVVQGF